MVWRALGGPAAWSDELWQAHVVEFRLRVLAWLQTEDGSKGRNRPEPPAPPPSRMEQQQTQAVAERRAEKYLRRQQQRG